MKPSSAVSGPVLHLRAIVVVLGLGFAITLAAQTPQTQTPAQAPQTSPKVKETLPAYEGQNVTTVELAGQPELDEAVLRPLLAQRAGEPFSQKKVNQSIEALQRAARLQAVELEVRPEANGIRVLLVLQPAVYFGVYQFPGATDRFAYARLLQVSDYPPRGAYTPVDVSNAQASLQKFFQRNGYFEAQVEPEVRTDKANGLANVWFRTTLGRRAKFGEVAIEGTSPEESARLKGKLRSFMARLRNSAVRPGKKYSPRVLQNATRYLEGELIKQDFLGGRVKLLGAEYDRATHRADIKFHVETGPPVHVKVEGAHVWGRTQRKLLPIYQQNGLDPELIQEGRQNLLSHFQSKGYFEVQVATQEQPLGGGQLIVYRITKGPRHRVAGVEIAGNQHLGDEELQKHVSVSKGRFLGRGKFSEKLVRASVKNLERVYQANGFSSVDVTPTVTRQGEDIVVTLRVNEGARDIVERLRVEGNQQVDLGQLAPQGLKVVEGEAYSTKLVDEDRNHVIARYMNLGYLTASFRATAKPVGKDRHRLEVVYQIYEGPRVETATVVTLGRDETRLSLIRRETDIRPGEPLRQDEMLASESKLYNLGVFDWASVDPRRTITTQTKEDVLVKVHEAKKNQIVYGFGFEVINRGGSVPSGTVALPGLPPVGLPSKFKTSEKTFWGPRGSFEYTRRDFRGKAETVTIGLLGARLQQRVSFNWTNPHFRMSDWISNLTASGENNLQNPIFSSRIVEGGLQFQHALNRDKTQNVFLRYNLRRSKLSRLLIPDLVPEQDRHVRLSTFAAVYTRDTRDSVLDAHKGIYTTAEFDLNPRALGSNVNFGKLLAQTAYYRAVSKGIVWANSLRLGVQQPFAGSHVPLSEKFFSGGGSTLRGFPLNGAGPQKTVPACGDPADRSTCAFINVPVGGNQLFILNSEFRIPVPYELPFVGKRLGLAAFYDGGNVYERVGFSRFFDHYSNTVGIGLRVATPVGPVRIDLGHNLNPLPGIKSTQLFITLGQAF